MEIKVCIGSTCHLKGSYDVIHIFKDYIQENRLEAVMDLKSSFCLGKCSNAVSVVVDADKYFSVSPDSARCFIEELHRWVMK